MKKFLILVILSMSMFFIGCENAEVTDDIQGTGLEMMPEDVKSSISTGILPTMGELPDAVDLSPFFPPIRSQGTQGSCATWALGYYYMSYLKQQEKQWSYSEEHLFSPAFLYNYYFSKYSGDNKNCSNGTNIINVVRILAEDGIVPLSDMAYDPKTCSSQPNEDLFYIAREYKIKPIIDNNPQSGLIKAEFDEFKTYLADNIPIIIGIRMYKNISFSSCLDASCTNSLGILDSLSTQEESGHAIVIVGYNNNKNAYKIINSWGTKWGENGFLWIDYDIMKELLETWDGTHGYILKNLPDDYCSNVNCSNHGNCVVSNEAPQCICDTGYKELGLECIKDCRTKAYTQCYNGNPYYFNDCDEVESKVKTCSSTQVCINIDNLNADCIEDCVSHDYKACRNNKVYWYDSCSIEEELVNSCANDQICKISGEDAFCEDKQETCVEGDIASEGIFSPCSNFSDVCDESGTKSRTNQVCRNNTYVPENETVSCLRNTDGDNCGTNQECSSGTCQSTCIPNAKKQCYNDDVYYYDSCGTRGSIYDNCSSSETCENNGSTNASCVEDCGSNTDHKQCYNDDVYYYDACNNRQSIYDNCSSSETCENNSSTNATCVEDCGSNTDHKQCYNDDVYYYDACNNRQSIYDNCSSSETCENSGSSNASCVEDACVDSCSTVSYTNPTSSYYNGEGGQVIQLRKTSTSSCSNINLTMSKPDGSNLGAGTYILRVGTCRDYGAERARVTITSRSSYTFTTNYTPLSNDYDVKKFCVTKVDTAAPHNSEAWFWSNFANVTKICD